VKKFYHTTLERPLTKRDLEQTRNGTTLEDGVTELDWIEPADAKKPPEVRLEMHCGKNREIDASSRTWNMKCKNCIGFITQDSQRNIFLATDGDI
jgi:16S rRNA U516 pseudouridylate synthase RsuA-like enzyme